MSKKKKQREAEAAAQAEFMAAQEANAKQEQPTPTLKRPSVTFRVMNNCSPVPVAKPADFIQLTPIVQPVPIVPYSTQLQPLAQFDEDED